MQKPFNAEGLDLSFLFDATYPDTSITEVNNVATASNPISGFTPEQTSSLQRMIAISIGEALEPLLRPLGEFLSAWNTGHQSLPLNPSSTHITPSESGYETQPSTSDVSYDRLSSTDSVKASALELVTAKRKANTLDEAVVLVAKKNCTFGLVEKESPSKPDLKGYSPEVHVKEEPSPGTLLSDTQSSSTEDHASIFLTPAPSQSDMRPAYSQGKAMEESSADTESMEGQQHLADTEVGELKLAREDQVRMFQSISSLFDSPMASHAIFLKQEAPLLSRIVLVQG